MKKILLGLLFAASLPATTFFAQAEGTARSDAPPERVLAIGGAVTEIVYALGEQDRLVGRDTTSTYPEAALVLPDIGYMRALSPEGALSVVPDLILADEDAGPPEALEVLRGAGIAYVTVPVGADRGDGAGVITKIETVAQALQAEKAAAPVIAAYRADLARLQAEIATITRPQRVMFVLSAQGGRLMASGSSTEADMIIRMAGGVNAVQGFEGYKPITAEAITAAAPDVILMMANRTSSSNHGTADAQIFAMPAVALTPAGQARRMIRMNGLYLLGFGPRTAQAALELNRKIYAGPHDGRD